ncbi:Crossover junction endodeoxyribonuclease RuvC [Peptoniphilus sp. ING2-D1G]|nr:Crossover junction endodeoxyribonuclease RuvC [Peptoniphilus sp. ING2-D1G]
MIILGIDPGLATIGYGVIEIMGNKYSALDYGIIKTEPSMNFPDRLLKIHRDLDNLINKYSPDDIAFEELFFNKNVKTALNVAHARGVLILTSKMYNEELYEYTPLQIKQAVVGYGRAEKHQIQEMVKMILNLQEIPRPDDAADALAVAIIHALCLKNKDLYRMK